MLKKTFTLCFLLLLSISIHAQSTETFETEVFSSTTFTDNSQIFNITSQAGGIFDIYVDPVAYGWNGVATDFRFIDNSGSSTNNIPVKFTISSNGGSTFKVLGFWIYLSKSNLTSLGTGGSLTIQGKYLGNSQYTATASSGFNTNGSVNNGYTFINPANFGGENNGSKVIDQLVITTSGSFEYAALDAFNWISAVYLPVDIISFNGKLNEDQHTLYWTTANEKDVKAFELECSGDGKNFSTIGSVESTLRAEGNYEFANKAINKNKMYYRLKIVDKNASFNYSKVILLNNKEKDEFTVYPNPMQDELSISVSGENLNKNATLYDNRGQILKTVNLVSAITKLETSALAKGNYYLKLDNGTSIKVIKEK